MTETMGMDMVRCGRIVLPTSSRKEAYGIERVSTDHEADTCAVLLGLDSIRLRSYIPSPFDFNGQAYNKVPHFLRSNLTAVLKFSVR